MWLKDRKSRPAAGANDIFREGDLQAELILLAMDAVARALLDECLPEVGVI